MTLALQTVITIIIMLITCPDNITAYAEKIPKFAKKTVQVIKSTIKKASCNVFLQNTNDSYKTTMLAITIATNMRDCTDCNGKLHPTNRNTQNYPGTRKLNDGYNGSHQSHTSRTHNNSDN